jgi:hypothetical protein
MSIPSNGCSVPFDLSALFILDFSHFLGSSRHTNKVKVMLRLIRLSLLGRIELGWILDSLILFRVNTFRISDAKMAKPGSSSRSLDSCSHQLRGA